MPNTNPTPDPVTIRTSKTRTRYTYKNAAIEIYTDPKDPTPPALIELCGPVEYYHHDSTPEKMPAPLRPLFYVILSWHPEIPDLTPNRTTGTRPRNTKNTGQTYLPGF